jgi:predicted amidophosphoribosyltransferase
MFKNNLPSFNGINFINYFIIKEDREKMGKKLSSDSRTFKILTSKHNETRYLEEITEWVASQLEDKKIIIIPFPSTNMDKKESEQLPFLVVKKLNSLSAKWVDGNGIILRSVSLPKNTRNENEQLRSLSLKSDKLKGFFDILIIDDVVTTGSSLQASLKLLLHSGYSAKALAIARKVHLNEVPTGGVY